MSDTPFMPLWVGDFMAKTQELDAKEAGAYMLLLMSMWTKGGSLPADNKKLQRVARVGRDWPKVWAAIKDYFTEVDGRIFNQRLTEELTQVNAKREVNARNGARGGRAKALKDKETHLANAIDSPQQPYSEPESSSSAREASPVSEQMDDDQLYDEVLSACGHRSGRIPGYWMPPAATIHVAKWRTDLGLSPKQIIDTARAQRAQHDEAPNGPKALDRAMQRLAAEVTAPPMQASAPRPAYSRKGDAPKPVWMQVNERQQRGAA